MPNKVNKKIDTILIIGLGLIGASLCKSIKKKSIYKNIIGYDNDSAVLDYAIKNNIVDHVTKDLSNGVENADFIVICTPVYEIKNIIKNIQSFLNTDKVFTDTLSSKNSIINSINNIGIKNVNNFVLSHPMAGTENYGIKYSTDNLFNNATTIICPMESSSKSSIEIVKIFWQSIDTVCVEILASKHDNFLSVISHSPHVISYVLANIVKKTKYDEEFPWINKCGSLSDLTRIAKSDPKAWKQIILDNKDNIINFIDEYILELDLIKTKIDSNNPNDLFIYLKNSKPKN